ncbi:flagellar biosynthesis sigma factor [Paraburkholderia sp. HP33-1]|uniref:flagellar biosynthesis sigma factor n=1 Tax=Paraburkholderia sp. HP33-1 TaxID=2883243 RepID=UPI001F3DE4CE|nr:flagellar biosynthesis sigma factor [Paraburkholderia sp. HP33-1]
MEKPVDEVALTLGEPYEQVRRQSHSTLPSLTEENSINLYVRRPAIFRLTDPRYGFATPAAKFLSLYANQQGNVTLVTLSPQVETLPLDESMAILTDLQNQFRRGGWTPLHSSTNRPIEDTPGTRNAIRACNAPTTRWQADNKYQVSLNIRCFRTDDRPNDERYLITLDLNFPVFKDNPDD